MYKKILPLVVATLAFSSYVNAEEVNITLSLPKSTYGIGALNKQLKSVEKCAIFVDDKVVANSSDLSGEASGAVNFKLKPGVYNFNTQCFSPADGNDNRQKYFQSETISQEIKPGIVNNVKLDLLVVNPKKVTLKVDSVHVNPGDWKIRLLDGEIRNITLNQDNEFVSHFYDENPVYKIYYQDDTELGQVDFEMFTLNLMPKKTVTILDSEQEVSFSVDINYGGEIFDPNVGIEISNPVVPNGTIDISLRGVPQRTYNLYVKNINDINEEIPLSGQILMTDYGFSIGGVNIPVNLDGDFTIKLASDFFVEGKKYKIYLIPL